MLLEKCIMGYYSILLWVLQFNSFSVSSPLTAFPGFITIVDCQRTYLVVGLPDLLFPASNVIGSEKLSAGACSPSSSWPPDAGESWSNATRRCSSRQLKQKLFPSFIIWTFPMIYTQVNFYRHGAQSGIQGDLLLTVPAISNPCDLPGMRHGYGGDLLKEMQGRLKDDIPLVIVLESNYVAFWTDNLIIFFGGVLNCSLSFTPLNLFQQIDFSICDAFLLNILRASRSVPALSLVFPLVRCCRTPRPNSFAKLCNAFLCCSFPSALVSSSISSLRFTPWRALLTKKNYAN